MANQEQLSILKQGNDIIKWLKKTAFVNPTVIAQPK